MNTPMRPATEGAPVIVSGELLKLPHKSLVPNPANPRILFDPEPLKDLKENIRLHGVLVPLTVFRLPDGEQFGILDGARRHRCCYELASEGVVIDIPCNVVSPPSKLAGLLYMFNIHNFREAWELMPTALSLQVVMMELGESDTKKLCHLTGLSEPQVERCKVLLSVDEDFRKLSLDPNPKTRIPSNFWIEAEPVLDKVKNELPDLQLTLGKRGVLEHLVEKYRSKKIKSVIHFRRIIEAFDNASEHEDEKQRVSSALRTYIQDKNLETRTAFDGFIQDARKVRTALDACNNFIAALKRAKIEHVTENREELIASLRSAKSFVDDLLTQLEGGDDPDLQSDGDNEDERE